MDDPGRPMSGSYASLADAVASDAFPDVDLALRRGRHVSRDDGEAYAFLVDAEEHLAPFYTRFGCELVHKSDGYFYLLPTTDRLGRRHLSVPEMLVGQALTLLYLDPALVEHLGVVTRDQVVAQLAGVMGSDALLRAMNPKRRRIDERLAEQVVRARVAEALRRLTVLGFVDRVDDVRVRLRPCLLRFAEPVRGAGPAGAALERLVARGELSLVPSVEVDGDGEGDTEGDRDDDDEGTDDGAVDDPTPPEGSEDPR
jgi:chromosome partition protein MukE